MRVKTGSSKSTYIMPKTYQSNLLLQLFNHWLFERPLEKKIGKNGFKTYSLYLTLRVRLNVFKLVLSWDFIIVSMAAWVKFSRIVVNEIRTRQVLNVSNTSSYHADWTKLWPQHVMSKVMGTLEQWWCNSLTFSTWIPYKIMIIYII